MYEVFPFAVEKGSETPFCDGEKGLRLPRSSCSDLGSEGVSDPFPHRKRSLRPFFQRGKPRTSQNPLSENPLSATHQFSNFHRYVPPCVAKTCALRPVFARVALELGAADPRICSKGPFSKC